MWRYYGSTCRYSLSGCLLCYWTRVCRWADSCCPISQCWPKWKIIHASAIYDSDTGNRKTNKHDILSRGKKKKKKKSPFISSFSVPGLFDQVLQTLNSLHSGLVVAQWKPEPSQRPPASSSVLILLLHHGCLLHLRGTTQRINIITSQTLRKCHFQLHSVN